MNDLGANKKRYVRILLAFALSAVAAILIMLLREPDEPLPTARAGEIDEGAVRALYACAAYAERNDFTSELTGAIEARVFGIHYRQEVRGGREKRGRDVVCRAESTSAFVKTAVKTEYRGGKYYVYDGEFRRGEAVYGEPRELSRAEYLNAYGREALSLTKYVLNGNILYAKNSGEGEYVFSLAPAAAYYCRNEIRTALGSESYPEYSAIELTLYADGERPLRIEWREGMRVDKFGGTDCTTDYCEVFNFDELP